MGSPLKNWVIPLENMGLPLKNFGKIKASPPKNAIFFNSNPKEILNFYNLPWRIPWFLNRGRGGGGRIFNGIAHCEFYVLTIENASSAGN